MYFKSLNFENSRLNEGLFSRNDNENIKQNCLPIDVTKFPDPTKGRLICLNTHFQTVLTQAIAAKKIIGKMLGGGALLSVLGGLAFGGVGALAGLPILLYTTYNVGGALLRQHDARDFMMIITDKDVLMNEDEKSVIQLNKELNDDYILKNSILSVNDGEVIYIYNEIRNGQEFNPHKHPAEGNHIIISHYDGKFYSLYAHLYYDSMKVKIGDKVEKGQIIALMGNTGNSTCPHLHFDMAYIDPRKFYSIGKTLKNFEPYKYTPLDLANENKEYWYNLGKKPLIMNKTGILHDACLLT